MSVDGAYTDVVELCALLQCLGFSVKSLETSNAHHSQEGGARTVIINCQTSGLHVVLESASLSCSCPATNQQKSGVWQVSGMPGGKHLDKEFGCTLLGSLPIAHREKLTKELREMIACIKQHNESVDADKAKAKEVNKSASVIELCTPENRLFQANVDTPTRYRSLDTLTTVKKAQGEHPLPAPGPLFKRLNYIEDEKNHRKTMCPRQSTYTLFSTPGSVRLRTKTSSPIQAQPLTLLESLIEAEKVAENLRNKLAAVIREFADEGRNDSSMSSLAMLDDSKMSLLKAEPSKTLFASSPNLSDLGTVHGDFSNSLLKRFESASTSNLVAKQQTPNEKPSRLRRISPNIFKLKKDVIKPDKPKAPEGRANKISDFLRAKIATPVKKPSEAGTVLSASKRKFGHVKSTIPRPIPIKKE